jgi:transposase-like protein
MAVNAEEHQREFYTLAEIAREFGVHRNTILYRGARLGIPTHQFALDKNIYFAADGVQTLRAQWRERVQHSQPANSGRKPGADAKARTHTGGKIENQAQ